MSYSSRISLFFFALGLLFFLSACGTDDYFDPELVTYEPESPPGETAGTEYQPEQDEFFVDRPEIHQNRDGTLIVGDRRYRDAEEFHTSPEFLENGHRCATVQTFTPSSYSLSGNPSDCSFNFTSIKPEYQPDTLIEIPVVFHVIQRTDGTGHIPESRILSQIDVLNEDFGALAGSPAANGRDARIRFVLANETPQGGPTNGINYHTNNQWFRDPGPGRFNPMMNSLNWDPSRYLNIYTNNSAGALGYASFPQESAGQAQDGVVLLHSTVGRNAPGGGIYNQGRTATHEVGHYFGLFHTFQGGCGSANNPFGSGDRIADTNQHRNPDNSCQPRQSSCGTGQTPIHNFMNYSPDSCMYEFTEQQINRMRCSLINYRPDLYVVVGSDSPTPPEPEPEPAPQPQPSAPSTLSNGESVAELSGASGSERLYQIQVPSSADSFRVLMSGGTGDADLYVRRGALPTANTFDCRPYLQGNNEECTFDNPAAGTWYIAIRGYAPYQGVSLTVEYESAQQSPAPPPAEPEVVEVTNLSAPTGGDLNYFIDVPSGLSKITFQITGGTGDADLYIREGAAPTTSNWDHRPFLIGNEETVEVETPASGRWHILINAYEAFSGLTLRVIMEE